MQSVTHCQRVLPAALFPEVDAGFVGLQHLGVGIVIVTQGQGSHIGGEVLGGLEANLLGREGAYHQNLLTGILPGVNIELVGTLLVFDVIAFPDAGQFFAQRDGLPVEIQNGIRIFFLLGNVDILQDRRR